MPRRDYEDDPNAPVANSLVPAASAIVVDDDGRVLLQRRADNEMWALPGGKMELGESIGDCAVRETLEETGISVEIVGIVGTYTNPGHVFAYDDGKVRQEFSICLLARPTGGTLRSSDESLEVAWFSPEDTDDLQMVSSIRKRIDDWRAGRGPVVH
ncbi:MULTISPECIES: NUDIX hydrolase [Streptomyces]|uniref:NUDIX hydrolase n=1 Tax=Streptomyces TaxID=1883 RepID=UPI0006AECB22|nr:MULTISPECIES: NUDIX domain-containing protein [unclassified Streptomyces]KOU97744.1 NUDIX hydrolase [Streptomyces sp. XY58]KOV01910.1 NUDIX hydrolase [Streptomyces sp. XY37]KOV14111.1 NUDIX hydrolase [Streptomyces sp. XY413]KOV41964.1 NUDIX hydrolase [Streptomyces sp. MMG1064]